MKAKQYLFIVVVALLCGGVVGYCSAQLIDRASDRADSEADRKVVTAAELRFLDGKGKHQVTLELGAGDKPHLVLKDSKGKVLCDLPPSLKMQPLGEH